MNDSTLNQRLVDAYKSWSENHLYQILEKFDSLSPDQQVALKKVMSEKNMKNEDNPNWPSKTGEKSGKGRGNNQ